MSNEIIKVLDELCARFGIAIDWTSENIMPKLEILTQKLVNYEYCTSIMWLIFGIVLIIVGIGLVIGDVRFDWEGMGIVLGGLIIICGVVVVMFQIMDIIACNTFPEKVILDYLKPYLKIK